MSVLTPLSNDPQSLTEYTQTLGVDASTFEYAEVFSLDPEMLAFLPPNPRSLIFLFPVGERDGYLEQRHQNDPPNAGPEPYFMKQFLGNACGTIAVIHSILNNLDKFKVKEGSWLSNFYNKVKDMTPDERGSYLQNDKSVQQIHEEAATEDTTPMREEDDGNHFIAFIPFNGQLWELDGRKPQPICHGTLTNFLQQVTGIITSEFYTHVPDPMETSMVLLCEKLN